MKTVEYFGGAQYPCKEQYLEIFYLFWAVFKFPTPAPVFKFPTPKFPTPAPPIISEKFYFEGSPNHRWYIFVLSHQLILQYSTFADWWHASQVIKNKCHWQDYLKCATNTKDNADRFLVKSKDFLSPNLSKYSRIELKCALNVQLLKV